MSIEPIVRCDVCKKLKGESNKWLGLMEYVKPVPEVRIFRPLPPETDRRTDVKVEDICSDTCLYKRLGQVLALIREESSAGEPVSGHVCEFPKGVSLSTWKCHCGKVWRDAGNYFWQLIEEGEPSI